MSCHPESVRSSYSGLCLSHAEYGGLGLDFSYNVAVSEELGNIRCGGVPMAIGVQTDMATPALARWNPTHTTLRFMSKEAICWFSSEVKRLELSSTITKSSVFTLPLKSTPPQFVLVAWLCVNERCARVTNLPPPLPFLISTTTTIQWLRQQ